MTPRKNSQAYTRAILAAVAFSFLTPAPAGAQGNSRNAHHPTITSFEVGPDESLTYPDTLTNIPDEHQTFIPLFNRDRVTYLVFASSDIKGGHGGTVVLDTTDLENFQFATDLGYNQQVMNPPVAFTKCNTAYNGEFDENYAAPGSVVQDPTLPAGNFIMIYEAENHCPGGNWQQPFYATAGFARSPDGGKTWPTPVNSEVGGPDRRPVVKGPNPEPASEPNPAPMGDAIPSAFVDSRGDGLSYIYVTYKYATGPGNGKNDGLVRIARARFGPNDFDNGRGNDGNDDHQLQFFKWYNGSFSEPGIGGLDSGMLPAGGCAGPQDMSHITYNDDLGLYLIVFVCDMSAADGHASWYYSTATSLDRQDWSAPQMILHSDRLITPHCNTVDGSGNSFDGFYPSFMSPGAAAGHTKLRGKAFFLGGCDTALPRAWKSRTFTITTER